MWVAKTGAKILGVITSKTIVRDMIYVMNEQIENQELRERETEHQYQNQLEQQRY